MICSRWRGGPSTVMGKMVEAGYHVLCHRALPRPAGSRSQITRGKARSGADWTGAEAVATVDLSAERPPPGPAVAPASGRWVVVAAGDPAHVLPSEREELTCPSLVLASPASPTRTSRMSSRMRMPVERPLVRRIGRGAISVAASERAGLPGRWCSGPSRGARTRWWKQVRRRLQFVPDVVDGLLGVST